MPGGGDPLGRTTAKASSAFPRSLMLSCRRQEPEPVECRGKPVGTLRRWRLEAEVQPGTRRAKDRGACCGVSPREGGYDAMDHGKSHSSEEKWNGELVKMICGAGINLSITPQVDGN
ncbi:unnamed protein product [Urochloa humidicola]